MSQDAMKLRRSGSLRKIIALELPLLGILMQTCVYAVLWFHSYYPLVRLKLKFWFKGHLLVLLIYVVLLWFFSITYGGLKVGYLKRLDLCLSQVFALIVVNVISYFQDSLLRNWTLPVMPMVLCTLVQTMIGIAWVFFCDWVYRRAFPPTGLLLIHGDRPIEAILAKFAQRKDKYRIEECLRFEDMESCRRRILERRIPVVLIDLPVRHRDALIKFCYAEGIRIYMLPKIPDVLIKGAMELHLFDTPLYMTREYALTFEQRFVKRAIDVTCSAILLVLTSPFFLLTAILVKAYDGGPVFYKQVRCTMGGRKFEIIKFRSMKTDAERDGKARLASKDDDRITPVGHFIRKCRLDELPQLVNILRGDMSFIGPRPERPEIIAQYVEEMPEFVFRMRVKAGLAGYAQIYGKYNTTPYDKLKLDLTYIQNYSVWMDIKLMLLTLKILFTPDATEGVDEGMLTALRNEEKEAEETTDTNDGRTPEP